MKKAKRKGFCGAFLNPGNVFVAVLFTAILCIPVCIFGVVNRGASGRITLLSSTYNWLDNPEQSTEWRTVRMRVTAYCPCEKCCGKHSDGQTACLHKICLGDTFVAAGEQYSFGTEMLVPGYNDEQPVKVLDRGGAIRGNRIDVFFSSHEEALRWGVRYLDVKVRESSQIQ